MREEKEKIVCLRENTGYSRMEIGKQREMSETDKYSQKNSDLFHIFVFECGAQVLLQGLCSKVTQGSIWYAGD